MTNFHQFSIIWHAEIIFPLSALFPCCKREDLKGESLKSETPEISGRQQEHFKLCFMRLLKMFSENEK